ncbi:MAG TPA: beta-ketoacyl-ACP synthase III [Acidimicrobiales bacterium]|nr:beta-ketoacyl-ACP synthase III [Acidimicrobiales bacterium]
MSAQPGLQVAIAGWGMAVPERRVTNFELSMTVDTSDEWITERTGIKERRVAGQGETTASLAIDAGQAAIKDAGIDPADIGLCIVATCTSEQPIPPTSSFVQEGLGLQCGAFDIDAACSGFVYALVAGASMVASGAMGPVLVIGSETLTRVVDPTDRSTVILFGDGAGAVVLTPSDDVGLLAWDLGCDGSLTSLLGVPAGGSRMPTSAQTVAGGEHWLKMDGREVFRRAVRVIVDSARVTLDRAGLSADDVALFIPHQANSRIIGSAASQLDLPPERTFVNIDRYGNTSAASVPIALAEAADAGRLKQGDIVLLSGFGAGMSWASALVRWER